MSPAKKSSDAGVGVRRGDVIGGRYEIVRLLGAGGMGAVFEARHQAIGKTVAIKILRPAVARDPQLAPRFLQEAQAANAVRHKNIVEILDFGVEEDRPYMVLEYLHGESLASLLERERWLPPGKIIRLLEPVIRALSFAHQRGVVHRDIKPDNIFLADEEGEDSATPKILDFGIAKQKLADNPRLTKTQTGLGTPSYMAPEQITAARDVTPAADQYAVGVILYEALCGRRSHEADSYETMIVAKVTQPAVALETRHPGIDPALAKIVMQALEVAPGDRFESVLALRDALAPFRDVLEGEEPPNLPPPVEPAAASDDLDDARDADEVESAPAPMGDAPTIASGPSRKRAPQSTTKETTPETWTTSAPESATRGAVKTDAVPASRGPWIGVSAVLAIGLLATIGWQAGWFGGRAANTPNDSRASTTSQAPATSAASTTPAPPATQTPEPSHAESSIAIRVSVQPVTAQILLDGSPIGVGAVEMTRPRDGRHYRLTVSAPGYSTIDEELVASADQSIERTLTQLAADAPPTAPPATPGEPPHTHRTGSSGGAATHRTGGSRGYPTLDRDNPF